MKTIRILAVCVAVLGLSGCSGYSEKPELYLYPYETTAMSVHLDYSGSVTCAYPRNDDGTWRATAHPGGTLTDASGRSYP